MSYSQVKGNLSGVVERLSGSVREETRGFLSEVRSKLQEETFNLVILGQFKRGKSTFINALLGEEILPTAIVPLTSVVTVLRYGSELKVVVDYLDDHREEVSLSTLPTYITERENPKNSKGVKEVTVFYPSEYLKGGVRIIDTPGAGSVYSHNTDVAYGYLPYVDAGIFVISADPPLSSSEHQFLKDVRGHVDKLFFLLNKIDQVSDSDRDESMEFTRRILEEDMGTGTIKIYPLSARMALEGKKNVDDTLLQRSLLPDFECHLQEFLIKEKGNVFLRSIINGLLKVISDETISFQLEQEAIKLPVQELTAKITKFEEEMKTIGQDRENNQFLLKGHLGKIISRLDEELAAFKREKLPLLLTELEAEFTRMVERGSGNFRNDLEQFVFDLIRDTFGGWRKELTDRISAHLESAHREFANKTNETTERILLLTSSIFELQLKPFTSVDTLSRKSEFYFLLKDDPVGLELIQLAVTSALPGFIARKMILNKMKSEVAGLVERHCGRVRYDLINRLTKTVKQFQKTLNEKIDLTLEGIRISFRKAFAVHQSSKADVEKNLTELSSRIGCISDIRGDLSSWLVSLDNGACVNSHVRAPGG